MGAWTLLVAWASTTPSFHESLRRSIALDIKCRSSNTCKHNMAHVSCYTPTCGSNHH